MKKFNFGFTLIELIVGITISILLMVSISLFVSNGLSNIYTQQKVLEDNYDTVFLFDTLKNIFNSEIVKNPVLGGSGFLLKLDKELGKGGFVYIGQENLNEFFCQSGSENTNTTHLFLKNFIPFEAIGGDIFSGTNYNSGGITSDYFNKKLTSFGVSFSGSYFGPNDVSFGIGNDLFISDTKGNNILKFDKTNTSKPGIIIAGRSTYGTEFVDGNFATGTYLNNPTGLAFGEGKLFISDTLNNRVLYLSGSQIYKLLDSYDGLLEPTGIFYDDFRKSLFISNSGKGEILEYSSSGIVSGNKAPDLKLSFDPNSSFIADKFEIEFLNGSIILNTPVLTGSYTFTNFSKNSDTGSLLNNKLSYFFLNNLGATINQTFNSGTTYSIDVKNITTFSPNDFVSNLSYYTKLSFYNGVNLVYTKYFPYFNSGDNLITTTAGNTLKTITGGLNYPTGISFDGTNIIVNDFLDRKQKKLDLNGNLISFTNLQPFNFSILNYDKDFDEILSIPLKSLDFSISNNLFTFILKYYKNYNCNNLDEKIERTFLLKKHF